MARIALYIIAMSAIALGLTALHIPISIKLAALVVTTCAGIFSICALALKLTEENPHDPKI